MHVPVLVPVDRHAACLAVAAYSVSYAQVQEALLRHYFRYRLASLSFSALRCNLHFQANGYNALLQRVSAEFQLYFRLGDISPEKSVPQKNC